MSLRKQAKTLSKAQIEGLLSYLNNTRNPERNRVIVLLSCRAGLRAKEIAGLTWGMVTDSTGNVTDAISLQDHASKGKSGRSIPLAKDLKNALQALLNATTQAHVNDTVIRTERSKSTHSQIIINIFARWFADLGFAGCSSHSGRRTFITNAARRISTVGGSLRDVQALAGHSSLNTTQRYIELNAEAKQRVVELV